MRIGIMTGEYPPMQGGIGDYTYLLAQHLTDQGADVSIFTDVRAQAQGAIHVHPVVSRWDGRAWLQARSWASDQQLDIISLQYQTAAFAMSPWIHFLPEVFRPLPLVTTFHDLRFPYLFPKADALRTWIVRRLARRSTAVIATTDVDAAHLAEVTKKTIIPIGTNIAAQVFEPSQVSAERSHWAQADDFLIGYFGLVNRTKGLHTLIEALSKLRLCGTAAQLLIIGGTSGASDPTNSAFEQELRHQIAEAKLNDAIHFTGYLDDKNAALALSACDVIALPYTDGASLRRGSLMAALALGCAIVTTTPQHPDRFISDSNMRLIPADDPASLAEALIALKNDPALRQSLRRAARETAQHFRWESIAHSHLAFFQGIVESAK